MKLKTGILIIAIVLAGLIANAEPVAELLYSGRAPGAVPTAQLATEIHKVASKYNLDPMLLAKLVLIESAGIPYSYNPDSRDWGLMQLNEATLADRNISTGCALNWRCNLDAGARLLAELQKHPSYRVCMYNVGKSGVKKKLKKCLQYEAKLARIGT